MRHVIIGNSYAAFGAMEAIRALDRDASITLISDEPGAAYARPLITFWLGGKVTTEGMSYRPTGWYERERITPLLGRRAVAIDTLRREVRLADGHKVPWDRLLIATGGRPNLPTIDGLSATVRHVHTFTRWDDARALKALCVPGARAVVLGGGLIGVKAAEGLNDAGVPTTIVHRGTHVLSAALDHTAGRMAEAQLNRHGIATITGATPRRITADQQGCVSGVVLADGRELPCRILVVATGVQPDAELARAAGIAVERGIVTDRTLQTSAPHVWAAGDVAQAENVLTGKQEVIAIVPVAYEQGRVAGRNMAGVPTEYAGSVPMNAVDLYGLPIVSVGIVNAADASWMETVKQEEGLYRKYLFHADRLVGALMAGALQPMGVLTHLIRSRRRLSSAEVTSLLTGDLLAFSVSRRGGERGAA